MAQTAKAKQDDRSPLERALRMFTDVHHGEAGTALLMAANVFLVMTAYSLIKPVREGLILAMKSGAEYKSYTGGAIAVALLVAVPAYARFADRLQRNRLVVGVTLFFASHLVLFWLASALPSVRPYLGLVFYLWLGIFNMMVVAQFWAFANDLYTEAQGKRLFPLLGLGQTAGAVAGATLAVVLVKPFGVFPMLLVSAGLLAACAFLTQLAHVRETHRPAAADVEDEVASIPEDDESSKPRTGKGAFELVLKNRYLLLIALFSLLFTWVNTNGEYMLGKLFKEEAERAVAEGVISQEQVKERIAAGFGRFFLYVNIGTVLLQAFVVSRVIRYGGMKIAFFVFPLIALADATAVAFLPLLAILRIGKTAENAVDYSLNNTVRNMLWLPTTRDMKYKAKQAVDTFFVRMGDVSSAVLVAVLAAGLGFGIRAFAIANVVLCVLWLVLAAGIVRLYTRLSKERTEEP
jgi:AAA family ATP:ADP antiporter